MTRPIRLALVGMGKIAHDQHLPSIAASPSFELVATVSRSGSRVGEVPGFRDLDTLARSGPEVDAVALCMPPQVRRAAAARAIAEGWHVFLEKPPVATLSEATTLEEAAAAAGITLFAGWHARFADGVEPARAWLASRSVLGVEIIWREDVRIWHPGQEWIWEPGGFGVFDPGINALSIATHILPRPLFVERAELEVPVNRYAPIAARVDMRDDAGVPVRMDLDFRQEGPQSWDIVVETNGGTLKLANGGADLTVEGANPPGPAEGLRGEYPRLYAHFAEMVRAGMSDVDVAPLRLVADAFLCGKHVRTDPFDYQSQGATRGLEGSLDKQIGMAHPWS